MAGERFIPAGAGNTHNDTNNIRSNPVYPRWRGEHGRHSRRRDNRRGLSPLARGTLKDADSGVLYGRFIPAGAGNTGLALTVQKYGSVYPRWRGEHWPGSDGSKIWIGLSPLARGTLMMVYGLFVFERFIPAGAGNTLLFSCLTTDRRGLSPLARGTQQIPADNHRQSRFIPAGAGNTNCQD